MVHVIIVAAGKGSRFGGDLPKQFCILGDRPVLMHTVIGIGRVLPNSNISIVLNAEYDEFWQKMCEQYGFITPKVVHGGSTRWESVKNALNEIEMKEGDLVLVHDGVRPIVQPDMVQRIIKAMNAGASSVLPVMPVTDSLRKYESDGTTRAADRSKLVAVQTPQAFDGAKLQEAYSLPYQECYTDDASVYQAAGYGDPKLVEGSPLNIKITHPRDIEVAALFMGYK